MSYLSAGGRYPHLSGQPAKRNLLMKNNNESTDDSATHESVPVSVGRGRKIGTAKISTH